MKAKKSLGQNFLQNPKILEKIANTIKTEGETIIEVGPGKGSLTEFLLKKGVKVVAIEKDLELVNLLKEKFKKEIESGQLELLHKDILEYQTPKTPYHLVGNIPYYITGLIFQKFLEEENPPKSIVFLLQKEVADRITARDGKESILSISIKVYGEPKDCGLVKAGNFNPRPKVDSKILLVSGINKKRFEHLNIKEKDFFEVLKVGFAHKRKFLIKNLEEKYKNREGLMEIFEKCGLDPKIRAEDLKVEDWFAIITRFGDK